MLKLPSRHHRERATETVLHLPSASHVSVGGPSYSNVNGNSGEGYFLDRPVRRQKHYQIARTRLAPLPRIVAIIPPDRRRSARPACEQYGVHKRLPPDCG